MDPSAFFCTPLYVDETTSRSELRKRADVSISYAVIDQNSFTGTLAETFPADIGKPFLVERALQ
jgi:hypothetical protein